MKNQKLIFTKLAALALMVTVLFSSCKKEVEEIESIVPTFGTVTLSYDFVWGMNQAPFSLNKMFVHPKTKDTLTFEQFDFYVSGIVLTNEDGEEWRPTGNYYLVSPEKSKITLENVPSNVYTKIALRYGIDEARHQSGEVAGELNSQLYFGSDQGFAVLHTKGTSPNGENGKFDLKLVGYQSPNDVNVPFESNFFSTPRALEENRTIAMKLMINPAKLWHSTPSVSQWNNTEEASAESTEQALNLFENINILAVE